MNEQHVIGLTVFKISYQNQSISIPFIQIIHSLPYLSFYLYCINIKSTWLRCILSLMDSVSSSILSFSPAARSSEASLDSSLFISSCSDTFFCSAYTNTDKYGESNVEDMYSLYQKQIVDRI